MVALLNPVWSKASAELHLIRQPGTVFIVGREAVVSIHRLD